MNYNEWKTQNTDGALDQYITICRKRRQVIDLSGAALSGAALSGADLSGADLRWADLRWAALSGADLSGADLSGADLRWAALSGADLSGAALRWADLRWAALRGADLSGADLRGADLSWAALSGADLSGADLSWADLSGADGPFTVGFFGRYFGIAAGGYIAIGYERHSYEAWLANYEEIGHKHEYTADEIADYGAWIKLAVARQRRIEGATN